MAITTRDVRTILHECIDELDLDSEVAEALRELRSSHDEEIIAPFETQIARLEDELEKAQDELLGLKQRIDQPVTKHSPHLNAGALIERYRRFISSTLVKGDRAEVDMRGDRTYGSAGFVQGVVSDLNSDSVNLVFEERDLDPSAPRGIHGFEEYDLKPGAPRGIHVTLQVDPVQITRIVVSAVAERLLAVRKAMEVGE